jgi:hypothetical protein
MRCVGWGRGLLRLALFMTVPISEKRVQNPSSMKVFCPRLRHFVQEQSKRASTKANAFYAYDRVLHLRENVTLRASECAGDRRKACTTEIRAGTSRGTSASWYFDLRT